MFPPHISGKGHALVVKNQGLTLFWGSGKLSFFGPSNPTGDIFLELLRLDGVGIPTPHTDLENNLYKMPNIVPGTEGTLTSPFSFPWNQSQILPVPLYMAISLHLSFQPLCIKSTTDVDLKRHK